MKAMARLCVAVVLLLACRSNAFAVTTEECQDGCSAAQNSAAQSCNSGCAWTCHTQGMVVHYALYIPGGCYANSTQEYCVVDGWCDCECEYI